MHKYAHVRAHTQQTALNGCTFKSSSLLLQPQFQQFFPTSQPPHSPSHPHPVCEAWRAAAERHLAFPESVSQGVPAPVFMIYLKTRSSLLTPVSEPSALTASPSRWDEGETPKCRLAYPVSLVPPGTPSPHSHWGQSFRVSNALLFLPSELLQGQAATLVMAPCIAPHSNEF